MVFYVACVFVWLVIMALLIGLAHVIYRAVTKDPIWEDSTRYNPPDPVWDKWDC